ncbi:tyrosine-type recombinase/integrase [Epilithonimonas zeae]|uniref:tyrosine-type recombinase/integrase n=1 Tax=Epilithonimonas zeae TaxID=1416779 RepID=UPI00200E6ED5|nr:tyrosine-type recombinase/integrase [Epilithonimonas zeae]UQB69972.1 tyrosine-type recombinase/integrase [Epilithonimonas zeae]
MMNPNLTEQFVTILRLQRYAERSIKTYTSHLAYFLKVSAKFNPEEITQQQLEDFIIWLVNKKKVGQSYQKAMIATITKFYKEIFLRNVNLKHLYPKRKEHKLPNFLTREEVKKILDVTENIKHKAILTTIYSCGLRLSEVLELKISDIKTHENVLLIRQAKGKKDRVVMLSPKLVELLRVYYKFYQPQSFLFEGQTNEKYSERSVQNILKNALLKADITSPASVHTLRHSYATHLLENGTDIRVIKELLGHNNIKTTEIYTQITDVSKAKVKSPLDFL